MTDMYGLTLSSWEQPEVPQILETSHHSLETHMQIQGDQIHEIEQELELVPTEHSTGQVFKLSQLQVYTTAINNKSQIIR